MDKNGPHPLWAVAQDVTKRFRLSRQKAKLLAELARRQKRTESDVIREGIELVQERDELQKARREAAEGLIAMIEGPEPKKIRFRMRY